MSTASKTNLIGEYKYRIYLMGLVLLLIVEAGLKYITSEGDIYWNMRIENVVAPIVLSWLSEKYAQRRLKVRLKWFGSGVRLIWPFLLSICGWAFFLWVATPGLVESQSPLRFFANATVIYLFSGAFFEMCNLIKVQADQ